MVVVDKIKIVSLELNVRWIKLSFPCIYWIVIPLGTACIAVVMEQAQRGAMLH